MIVFLSLNVLALILLNSRLFFELETAFLNSNTNATTSLGVDVSARGSRVIYWLLNFFFPNCSELPSKIRVNDIVPLCNCFHSSFSAYFRHFSIFCTLKFIVLKTRYMYVLTFQMLQRWVSRELRRLTWRRVGTTWSCAARPTPIPLLASLGVVPDRSLVSSPSFDSDLCVAEILASIAARRRIASALPSRFPRR